MIKPTGCQKQVSPKRAKFTETDIWNHFKIERVSRNAVSKSYDKVRNDPTFDPKQKSDQNR